MIVGDDQITQAASAMHRPLHLQPVYMMSEYTVLLGRTLPFFQSNTRVSRRGGFETALSLSSIRLCKKLPSHSQFPIIFGCMIRVSLTTENCGGDERHCFPMRVHLSRQQSSLCCFRHSNCERECEPSKTPTALCLVITRVTDEWAKTLVLLLYHCLSNDTNFRLGQNHFSIKNL